MKLVHGSSQAAQCARWLFTAKQNWLHWIATGGPELKKALASIGTDRLVYDCNPNPQHKIVGRPYTTKWIWKRTGHPADGGYGITPGEPLATPPAEWPIEYDKYDAKTLCTLPLSLTEAKRKQYTSVFLGRETSDFSASVPEYRSDLLKHIDAELNEKHQRQERRGKATKAPGRVRWAAAPTRPASVGSPNGKCNNVHNIPTTLGGRHMANPLSRARPSSSPGSSPGSTAGGLPQQSRRTISSAGSTRHARPEYGSVYIPRAFSATSQRSAIPSMSSASSQRSWSATGSRASSGAPSWTPKSKATSKLGDSHFRKTKAPRVDLHKLGGDLIRHTGGGYATVTTDGQMGHDDIVRCLLCGHQCKAADHLFHRQVCSGVPYARLKAMTRREHAIFETRRLQNASVLQIQSWFRGCLARKFCYLKAKVELKMVIKIQSIVRMWLSRRHRRGLWQKRLLGRVRGLLTVASVLQNELQIRRFAATKMAKYVRGLLARIKARNHRAARTIEAGWRAKLGRKKAFLARVERVIIKNFKRWRVQIWLRLLKRATRIVEGVMWRCILRKRFRWAVMKVTMPIHAARVLQGSMRRYWWRRSAWIFRSLRHTAAVIQRGWRCRKARDTLIQRRNDNAATVIQRAARAKLAKTNLWKTIASRHYAALWIQRRMRHIWLRRSARYYWELIKRNVATLMQTLAEELMEFGNIPEAEKVYSMAEIFRDANFGSQRDLLRFKVLRAYHDHSKDMRRLFLRISTEGVNDPSKAFKLTGSNFGKLVKDTGIMQKLPQPAVAGIIFMKCNSNEFEMAVQSPKSGPKASFKSSGDDSEDRTMEMDEFVEALVRLGAEAYGEEGDVADTLRMIIENHLLPLVEKIKNTVDSSDTATEEDLTLVDGLMQSSEPKLKKLFKFYCGHGNQSPGGDVGGDADMSCFEFLLFSKECQLASLGLSFSRCLETFIASNEEEVDEFIGGTLTDDLTEALQMDFDEFLEAVKSLVLRMPVSNAAQKAKQINKFFTHMFASCPHYHLNLVEV